MHGGREHLSDGRKTTQDELDYANLLLLEEMESLLEELEDRGISGELRPDHLPDDIAELVRSLNVQSLDELSGRISALHATLDRQESETGPSD